MSSPEARKKTHIWANFYRGSAASRRHFMNRIHVCGTDGLPTVFGFFFCAGALRSRGWTEGPSLLLLRATRVSTNVEMLRQPRTLLPSRAEEAEKRRRISPAVGAPLKSALLCHAQQGSFLETWLEHSELRNVRKSETSSSGKDMVFTMWCVSPSGV